MPNENPQKPIEGKGEEMIPERGLPFDDIEEMADQDSPPENIAMEAETVEASTARPESSADEAEKLDSLEGGADSPEAGFQLEETAEAPPATAAHDSEVLTDSQAEEPFEADSEAFFEFPEKEREALIGDVADRFATEATPWDFSEEEAESLAGDAANAFTLSDLPTEAVEAAPTEQPLPEGMKDGGMSTHQDDLERIAEFFSEAVYEAPGPEIPADLFQPSEGPKPDASQEMLKLLIKDEDMSNLWKRSNQAQKDVNEHITTLYIAQPLLDHIQKAREQLMSGKENYEDAERHINQVEYRVQLNRKLDEWGRSLIRYLFVYLGAFFLVLIVLLLAWAEVLFTPGYSHTFYLGGSMIWGGIGGIVGALLPLIKHFSEDQDFSKQHTWWYYASPFVGVAMGAIIYLFVSAGALSITAGGQISSPMIIYILAGLSGYQHNIFTDLVKRMLKALEIGGEEKQNQE